MPVEKNRLTRRKLLIKGVKYSLGALIFAKLGCSQKSCSPNNNSSLAEPSLPEQKLTEEQKMQQKEERDRIRYVEKSPFAARNCGNCKIFHAFSKNPDYGSCQILTGSVAKKGYCIAWIPRM